jgi:hypothetical protein
MSARHSSPSRTDLTVATHLALVLLVLFIGSRYRSDKSHHPNKEYQAGLTPAERQSPRRVLEVLVATTGKHEQTAPAACRVLMEGRSLAAYIPAIRERVQAAQGRAQAGLEQLVRAGVEAGEWPPDTNVAIQARVLAASIHGLMAAWHVAPGVKKRALRHPHGSILAS